MNPRSLESSILRILKEEEYPDMEDKRAKALTPSYYPDMESRRVAGLQGQKKKQEEADEQEAEETLKKLSSKGSSISSQMVVSSLDPGTKIQTKPVTFSRSKMIESVVSDLIRRTAK
jgi:hypothetical protein